MLNFKHSIPTTIYFGKGQIRFLKKELTERGVKNLLLVTGGGSIKKNGVFDSVIEECKKAKVKYVELSGIAPNPRLSSVYQGIDICRKEKIDFILAVGGGSVIDAAKAIAAGVCYEGDVWNFYENKDYPKEALPLGSVLTLAATGTEMNGNSVITNEKTSRKLAIGNYLLIPKFSILDPEYTFTVNAYHTAAGVADIMAHIFEQYFSHTQATDVQDRVAEALLKVCIQNGHKAVKEPENYDARANILWAGTLALNSLIGNGKVQDWATHDIEHELSAYYDISHGAGLAILFPHWMRFVLDNKTLPKFLNYAQNVWNIQDISDKMRAANSAIDKTAEFFRTLGLPASLKELNINSELFEKMAENVIADLGTDGTIGSFKKLSKSDIIAIFEKAGAV